MVTEGRIDLPYMGMRSPVPENVGSKVSATPNGKPYIAWAVNGRLQDYMGRAGVAFDSHSSLDGLDLMMVGVAAPGTYPISNTAPSRRITVGSPSAATPATAEAGRRAAGQ